MINGLIKEKAHVTEEDISYGLIPFCWRKRISLKMSFVVQIFYCHNFATKKNRKKSGRFKINIFDIFCHTALLLWFCPTVAHCALVKLLVKRFVAWGDYIVLATTEHYHPPPSHPTQMKWVSIIGVRNRRRCETLYVHLGWYNKLSFNKVILFIVFKSWTALF